MASINILDDITVNKIAAGEVVEKPMAVIKELVENAIDAKASSITVEIKNGGLDLMRITDNGCGIPGDEIEKAFCRHATSKINRIEDLDTLCSLGFRGEALASIASVAQVECISKTAAQMTGIRYEVNGSVEVSKKEVGCPDGTTFVVKNLFYNTPARRKFLKSPTTEGSYISDLIEKLALSHPDISFRYIYNGKLKFQTNGNGKLKDVIYQIYGRDITANIIPFSLENEYITVTGFIGKPVISKGNRTFMNYFVNGRYVKSPIIYRALEEGYNGFHMSHKYPFCVLLFEADSNKIDVILIKMFRMPQTDRRKTRQTVLSGKTCAHLSRSKKTELRACRKGQTLIVEVFMEQIPIEQILMRTLMNMKKQKTIRKMCR